MKCICITNLRQMLFSAYTSAFLKNPRNAYLLSLVTEIQDAHSSSR